MSTWTSRLERNIEGLIRALSPAWASKRATYRALELEALAAFRDAKRTRLDTPRGRAGQQDNLLEAGQERLEILYRAREAERSNVIAESMLSRSVDQANGDTGLVLKANSGSEKWDRYVEESWCDWGEHEADVRGLSTLAELDGLKLRSFLRDGDVGTILLADEKLQVFEADQLASPWRPLNRNMVDGIELDARGRPISFHVVADPDPVSAIARYQKSTEIPAEFVSYIARRQRVGQTRGLSAFAGSLWLLDQIDGNIAAVTSAARMAACLGIIVNRKNPRRTDNGPTSTGSDGVVRKKLTFAPGSFWELGEQDKVTTLTPSQPTTNFADFMAALCRFAGLGFGLPLELILMDFTRSNYSQARGALLQAHKTIKKLQAVLARDKTRIYTWWLVNRMRTGKIPYRAKALRHTWTPPARELLDPEKELKAALGLVDANLSTLAEVAGGMGRDWVDVFEQRKREVEKQRELGLPEVRSTLTRDPSVAGADQGAEGDETDGSDFIDDDEQKAA